MPNSPPLLDCRRITVMRGPVTALDDVSLAIGAGEHPRTAAASPR
jgi:hypothetical protein